jgi:signal peptidase I
MVIDFEEPDDSAHRVSWARWIVGIVVLFVLLVIAFALFQKKWVPKQVISNSMFPTLVKGEYIFVDCRRNQDHAVGDVVMLVEPNSKEEVAKRIVALGGQKVEWKGGVLTVDGAVVTQVTTDDPGDEVQSGYRSGMDRPDRGVSVPAGHVFVMEDYWQKSFDSWDYGAVPREALLGKARFVYWPLAKRREIR